MKLIDIILVQRSNRTLNILATRRNLVFLDLEPKIESMWVVNCSEYDFSITAVVIYYIRRIIRRKINLT